MHTFRDAMTRSRSVQILWLIVVAIVAAAIAPTAAHAEPEVVVAGTTPTVKTEADGTRTAELKFTNASTKPVTLSSVAVGEGCEVSPAKSMLPAEKIESVTLTIPDDCGPTGELAIEMTPEPATGQVTPFVIEPTTGAAVETDWSNLWAFAIAAVGAILFLLAELVFLAESKAEGLDEFGPAALLKSMPNVPVTWKFDDNWVTGVTAVGALFTGIFTAATGKAFLGQETEAGFALATVGALVAAVLVAVAPIFLAATKSVPPPATPRPESHFTVGGVTVAAALVLGSAFGQLWVVLKTAESLELGGLAHNLKYPFAIAGLLLVVYAWRSFREIIERGLEPKKPATKVTRKKAQVTDQSFAAAAGPLPTEGPTCGEVEIVEHPAAPSALI